MGVCYSTEQDWQEEPVQVTTTKKIRKKKKKHFSAIEEERSQYDASFASVVEDDLRNSLYETIQESSEIQIGTSQIYSSVVMGSVVEMNHEDQNILLKNLTNLNPNNERHSTQLVRFCNFKSKNFLHTHRVKLEKSHHFNEISCCPYDASHDIDYDTWKLEPAEQFGKNYFYIYHPFTKRYLTAIENLVAAGREKYVWEVESLGARRNRGFVTIRSQEGELCMADSKALMKNHRAVMACHQSHISHLWQLIFVE